MGGYRQFLWAAGGLVIIAGTMKHYLGKGRKSAAQYERERREKISATGRITDGTVLDVREAEEAGNERQFLIYSYDVGGVEYECSQEVTELRPYINMHSCRLGLPASVKYDPHNPGNSILAAETWMGLRK